jgi:hypothetical protein
VPVTVVALCVTVLLLLLLIVQGAGLPAAAPRVQPGDHWTFNGEHPTPDIKDFAVRNS